MAPLVRLAAPYFALQAVAVPAWWLLLWLVPASRPWFFPSATLPSIAPAELAMALPDLLLLAGGSAVTAFLAFCRSPHARSWAYLTTGAAAYATLYTLAWVALAGAPVLSAVTMLPTAVLSLVFARELGSAAIASK